MQPIDAAAPVRAILVGAGGIADAVHMPAIREIGGAGLTVEAVVEIDRARGAAFAGKWGIPAQIGTLTEALELVHPELAILCTPPGLHREQVSACLAAGVTVWCEKPSALNLADYDAMIAGERDGGPYAPIVLQHRFGSGARHARSLLKSGAIGRPLIAHCQTTWFRDDDYFAEPWRGTFDGDGGPVTALGVHQIDLMLSLLGDWDEVTAYVARLTRRIETGDVAVAAVRLASGALATIANSAVSADQVSGIRIDTDRATIELKHLYGYGNDDWTYTPAPGVDEVTSRGWVNPLADERSTHTPQLRQVIADLRAGSRPETSGDGGRRALELVTALYKSALTGHPVTRGSIVAGDPFYERLNGGISVPAPGAVA